MTKNVRQEFIQGIYRFLTLLNDLLLIPMFILIVEEVQYGAVDWFSIGTQDLLLNVLFFTEWALGLYLSKERAVYLRTPLKIMDLISSLPFATLSQGVRLARLSRVVKLFRLISRAKQYQGVGAELLWVVSVFSATVFAGGYCFYILEPHHPHVHSVLDAMWWSLITVSTVGYGDVVPETIGGRLVATPLIMVGIGVGGYIAGFMSRLLTSDSVRNETKHLIEIENQLNDITQLLNRLLEQQSTSVSESHDD